MSGPLGLYKTSDLISVLGPWILQSFLGKETTFGDDRHLTNRILSLGHWTGYSHLAKCESDTPAGFVRWVKQQTRWSKSFFREAFWFPKSFAYAQFWLTVETTKQFMYPVILSATVLKLVYLPRDWIYPLLWLGTMFGVALIKSTYGVICMRDPTYFLFSIYGFMVSSFVYRIIFHAHHPLVLLRSFAVENFRRLDGGNHDMGYICTIENRGPASREFLFAHNAHRTVSTPYQLDIYRVLTLVS